MAVLLLVVFRLMAVVREDVALGERLPGEGALVATDEGMVFVMSYAPGDAGAAATPLLFAHGTAAWSGLWRPTLKRMAEHGFRAEAFDMPPFGFSAHAEDGDYSRTRQAERVIALLERMDHRPIIVAHSIGAGPMAEAVLARPDLVSGLVLVAGAIALGSHEAPETLPAPLRPVVLRDAITATTASNPMLTGPFLRQFIHIKTAATPERIAVLREPTQRIGYTKAVSQWLPQLFETPRGALSTRPAEWRGLEVPVALIWGTEDTVTPPEQARELVGLLPDAPLILLDGVGHIPQIEAPEAFEAALLEALEAVVEQTADRRDAAPKKN